MRLALLTFVAGAMFLGTVLTSDVGLPTPEPFQVGEPSRDIAREAPARLNDASSGDYEEVARVVMTGSPSPVVTPTLQPSPSTVVDEPVPASTPRRPRRPSPDATPESSPSPTASPTPSPSPSAS